MREWFLLAIMVVVVFGPMLLDELSRRRIHREASGARPIVHGPINLVPDEDEQNLLGSRNAAPVGKTKEYVA